MTRKQTLIFILTTLGVIALFAGPPSFLNTHYEFLSFACMAIGGATILIMLLEVRQDRFVKGLMLIGLAVFFPAVYPLYLNAILLPDKIPGVFKVQLDIFSQIMVLACSGAGGGLIANHGETNTTEYQEREISGPATVDNTKNIELLITHTHVLKRKLNQVILICTTAMIAALIALLFVALKS